MSGKAKDTFNADLAKRKAEKEGEGSSTAESSSPTNFEAGPKSLNVEVNGEQFKVNISYDGDTSGTDSAKVSPQVATPVSSGGATKEVLAPLEGKAYMTKDSSETAVKVGDKINEGDIVCYIEAMKVINAVKSEHAGTVVEICFGDADDVFDDDVLFKLAD